ncbi:MAG: hypothetical protein Q4G51_11670 [Dermatophilus congolensis]|nr:hypothetical protein [Dermatophilus congolensis]
MADGRAFAVSAKAVDIAWEGNPKAASYSIVRDGSTIAELGPLATSYRDAEVSSGNTYQYQVIPHPREDKEAGFLPFWGFEAVMPALGGAGMVAAQDSKELTVGEADSLAESMAKAAATEATAAIGWKTFIAESRIPVPTFGPLKPCTYDNSHDFGGDGRSWDAHSPRYRTSLAAYVKWSDKSVTQGSKIGPTNVYRGSTLVATQTAPKDSMIARKIGSTSSSIDVQFNFSARNPFCGITSKISGAMIIRLTAGGSYLVLQGSHVQMPAHQVYILRGASTADVYRASAVGPICLAGYVFCPERDMTGLSGKY